MEVMEPLEAVEDMKAHMENTIWMRTMKRPKQPKNTEGYQGKSGL